MVSWWCSQVLLIYIAATFLFGLNYKEKHHLSQTVTNLTVVHVNELVGKTYKQDEKKMAADTLNFSELKNLKLLAIKQKMLDLGLDTKGSKADLLVKLEKHVKVRKADSGSVSPCVPGFAARSAWQSRL